MSPQRESSSFRDPSGFVFKKGETLLRQVNFSYKEHYDFLLESGLYDELTKNRLLVRHTEEDVSCAPEPLNCYKVVAPEIVPFVSYPYEWCFGQLKAAALLTLKVQKIALSYGMILKDASAFNIQFFGHEPIFIDSLSFEKYEEAPWVAYKQFCEHFFAPLALMRYRYAGFGALLRVFLDGLPLSLASLLLPKLSFLKPSLLFHVHLHARVQNVYKNKRVAHYKKKFSKKNLLVLIDSLERAISGLEWNPSATEWADYYTDTNYSEKGFRQKKDIIHSMLVRCKPKLVWDMGANEGVFSRLASGNQIYTVALDIDPAAVEKNYRQATSEGDAHMLPLFMNISNPSPALGWNLEERKGLLARGPADVVIASALIHHLVIGGNATFDMAARFFKAAGKFLIIEFVPKEDSQVTRLLSSRKDIFSHYTQESFEKEFTRYFTIKDKVPLMDSKRTLYLMDRHET